MASGVIMAMTLSGDSVADILLGLRASGVFPAGKPDTIEQGVKTLTAGDDWFQVAQTHAGTFTFGEGHTFLFVRQPDLVKISLEGQLIEPVALLGKLAQVPFDLAAFTSFHHDWASGRMDEVYRGPSFGKLHSPLGWGCAFRGQGHQRMLSRRWLEFGPWRILHADPDTTLLQFFDLTADASAALAQARIGHERLIAGFLPEADPEDIDLQGLYSRHQRKLIITVKARTISAKELREAAIVRRFQSFGEDKPIDNIVYVFVDEAEAMQHLEAMWFHGFEVRLIGDDGQERRIDEGFEPRVQRPAWVPASG
ncbi:MAG: hypothetical protein IPI67_34110 [Myxococcales bacterium]|nr:hypothetical protein [Myxococcales bacterium]